MVSVIDRTTGLLASSEYIQIPGDFGYDGMIPSYRSTQATTRDDL